MHKNILLVWQLVVWLLHKVTHSFWLYIHATLGNAAVASVAALWKNEHSKVIPQLLSLYFLDLSQDINNTVHCTAELLASVAKPKWIFMCIAAMCQQTVFHRAGHTCDAFLVSERVLPCMGTLCWRELHVQPSFAWTTSCNTCPPNPGPPQSLWPFWSLFPVLKVPGQSTEVHLNGRSKAQHGRGTGFHDSKPHGYVCFLQSCVSSGITGTTLLLLVLPNLLKAVGNQVSFCRVLCLPWVFAPSPSNYKVQCTCPLSDDYFIFPAFLLPSQ